MSFAQRLFAGYVLLVALGGWLFFREYSTELVPAMRQPLEEAMVDTAHLLAALVEDEVREGRIGEGAFARGVHRFSHRNLEAEIWSLRRHQPDLFVYVTDAHGIVTFDSRGRDLGADYSRWNDVYLTLRGRYGARTSREDEADPTTSAMYVAAPIRDGDAIVGVLTVGKPSLSVQRYVEQMEDRLLRKATLVVLLALGLAGLLSLGLSRSVGRLTRWSRGVQEGRRLPPPDLHEPELAALAEALEGMRCELEGKDYVERYVHTLTHELKSPLAAIGGASELLGEPMGEADRRRFVGNIQRETRRMQRIVERLLALAVVENRQGLERVEDLSLTELLASVVASRQVALNERSLQVELDAPEPARLPGERFLLEQALGNLLDNAVEFSAAGDTLRWSARLREGRWIVRLDDQGPGIPDYARERIFERFYSLPRPDGAKSSGLGLAFVREVAALHGGTITLRPGPDGGTSALLELPTHSPPT